MVARAAAQRASNRLGRTGHVADGSLGGVGGSLLRARLNGVREPAAAHFGEDAQG